MTKRAACKDRITQRSPIKAAAALEIWLSRDNRSTHYTTPLELTGVRRNIIRSLATTHNRYDVTADTQPRNCI
ncbi:hypothetical protein J6590_087787 [Homalodisca vitripennis]|nr:hypothetical protein J6590_087787 [Homalodisca vitripennis]